MELKIKHLLVASLCIAACLGTDASAKNRGSDASTLNQLVNNGIISPQQADQIGGRAAGYGGGGLYLGTFGFGQGNPQHYDSNTINNSARALDKLHGDRLITDYELNALKSQLTARVKLVNENPGITTNSNYGNWHNGFQNGYPAGPVGGAVDPTGGYRPRGYRANFNNNNMRPGIGRQVMNQNQNQNWRDRNR